MPSYILNSDLWERKRGEEIGFSQACPLVFNQEYLQESRPDGSLVIVMKAAELRTDGGSI